MKVINIGTEARNKAVDALNFIAKAVGTTLGPKGLSFIIERNNHMDGKPTSVITKDGISVLKSFDFTDPIEHAVHSFCVQASSHTVYAAGDGPMPLWSKILTPNGFIEMKDVCVGQEICGTNGSIQKILGVFPKGEKEIYKVAFSNKRIVECCEDHLWTVTNTSRQCRLETKPTKELQKDYVTYRNNKKISKYYTPRTFVEFTNNEENLPLDAAIHSTKSIPKAYLYSSLQNRIKLFQSLINTAGHIKKRGTMEFSSVSEQLANDFVELCRSLGKTANIVKIEKKTGDLYYKVHVTKGPKYGNKIERITATGKTTQMQCIKVSNPDNLYITDNYIATHNTTSTIVLASAIAQEILKAAPDQPQSFAREIQKQAQAAIKAIKAEADCSSSLAATVAYTASNGDQEMVDWTMKTVEENPVFGSIIIERNPATQDRYQLIKQDGLTGGRGYGQHLQFAHSFSDKTSENAPFEITSPYILLYDGDLISQSQIAPILNKLSIVLPKPWTLVIVAYEIGQEVANLLAQVNLQQKDVKIWASSIRLTAELNSGWHKLKDIGAFCGTSPINAGSGCSTENIKSVLGVCSKVQVTPEKTLFIGRSSNHWIPKRALQNDNGVENAVTELDKERIRERNAELVSGLIKLVVGGGHLAGIGERADRCDDAIKAAQACLRNGALPGCGSAFIRAGDLAGVGPELKRAFRVIHEQIMDNYGHQAKDQFKKDETIAITDSGIVTGDFRLLRVADSYDTIASVIKNAVELGVLFATLGGYSLTGDLHELENLQRVKSIMG